MKRKLRGIKRSDLQLDFDLYRVSVPMPGVAGDQLSAIDILPSGVTRALVFVHGFAGCAETWEHQISHFAKEYRVVAPDLRGHGQSDAPYTRYTMSELVADLHAIVEQLNLPPRFVLIGHSFGGSICVEYAAAHPDRLERLVLIATAGEYPLPKAAGLAARLPTALLRPVWDYRPAWNAEVHVLKRMAVNNMMQWQGWTLLRRLRTPTLVITGERDTYFPRYVFEDVGRMIPGAQVVDVGVSKHKVQLERHQAVNRAIERFIEQDERRTSWRDQSSPVSPLAQRPWLKAYGRDIPTTVPIPRQPLHSFLESAAEWLPKRVAVSFFGARLTYAQLNRQANQFAHVLHGLGLDHNDRVMILLPNMPELVIAAYGTLKMGGVVVFANPDASPVQIGEQARQTGAKVLVTLQEFDRQARIIAEQSNISELILTDLHSTAPSGVVDRLAASWGMLRYTTAAGSDSGHLKGRPMADLLRDAPPEYPDQAVDPQRQAAILFTGGATGALRPVGLSHANLVANAIQVRHWIPTLRYGEEVFLSVVPLLHSYGLTAALNLPITVGATMVLLPVFDLNQVLHHIWTDKPTLFPGVPAMFAAIKQAPNLRSYGLAGIKTCLSSAAPLPVEVQESFEKLTQSRLIEGYGLTEAALTHADPLLGQRKAGSIGVPLPNTDAKVVDLDTGQDLPAGQVGELLVKGPQVATGEPEPSSDGWLHTRDIAVMDSEGVFQIIGRASETITVSGHCVYPRDVEEVLYENNRVLEAAVVGAPDGVGRQRIVAFVVPRSGATLTSDELLDLCRRRLDDYAVPTAIEIRPALPKSFLGTVLRKELLS